MKFILLVVMLLGFVPGMSFGEDLAQTTKMDLFLLIGQSNMAGRGKIEAQDQVADPKIWKLDKEDKWVPGIDPLHFDKPTVAGVGLGLSFARAMVAQHPERFVGLVPAAVGGTSIEEWAKGGKLYEEAVRRCKVAQKHGTLRAILWHQGESDSTAARVPTYMGKLKELMANLRQDLSADDVPVVVGEIGYFHEVKTPFGVVLNKNLKAVAEVVPNSACASAEGLTDKGDQTHFDSASLRTFGKRYAYAYLKLIGETKEAPDSHPGLK